MTPFDVAIEAYVRLSFNDEVELTGYIGDVTLTIESKTTMRSMVVTGDIGGLSAELTIGRLHPRKTPVRGEAMGQPVTGNIMIKNGTLTFDGMAGEEPLHYTLEGRGTCRSHDRDLGLRIQAQAFYSEIVGTVGRVPDAAMIALLLPVRLAKTEEVYS